MLNDRLAGLKMDRLRSFLAVVRHGSFSAAAESLFLPQPRVSGHVADLERLFGVQLFDRSCQPVALTDGGRQLLPHVQAIIDSLASAVRDLGDVGGTLGGRVVVGMYPSAAAHCYGELVRRMRTRHPGVEVLLWEGSTLELDAALTAGDVDLAVRPSLPEPENVDRLAWEHLWREPIVAVFPSGEPEDNFGPFPISRLAGRPLITIGSSHGPRDRVTAFDCAAALDAAGLADDVAFRTNQPQTLVSMVRASLGVGVTNHLAVSTSDHRGVRVVPLTGEGCNREVALWWRARMPLSAAVVAVAETCRDIAIPFELDS